MCECCIHKSTDLILSSVNVHNYKNYVFVLLFIMKTHITGPGLVCGPYYMMHHVTIGGLLVKTLGGGSVRHIVRCP